MKAAQVLNVSWELVERAVLGALRLVKLCWK
jgi:hypothetical protein